MEDNVVNTFSLSNAEITAQARVTLKGRWCKAASLMLVAILFELLIPAVLNFFLPTAFKGIVKGIQPLVAFFINTFLLIWALKLAKYNEWTSDFTNETAEKFGSFIGSSILVGLFTFLWTLLLIIPGIIAAFNYAMTFYILLDNPAMPVTEAIKYSKKMMYGNRWKLFCLNFRFIGWGILLAAVFVLIFCIAALLLQFPPAVTVFLGLLFAGIGWLFLVPYIMISHIHFYNYVRSKYEAQNGEIPSSDYSGMSAFNTALLIILVFVFNAGVFYLASLGKCIGQ